MDRYPTLSRGLLLSLTHRLMEMTRRLAELTGSHVEPRFARLFLKLADEMGRREGDAHGDPDHADAPGTRRPGRKHHRDLHPHHEPVEQQDIVTTGKAGFVIVDRRTLEALAQC